MVKKAKRPMIKKLNFKNIEQVNHVLASTGFIFPRTEQELDSFDKFYVDHDFKLNDYQVNIGNIIAKP